MRDRSGKPPPLDYATPMPPAPPPRRDWTSGVGFVFGALFGLLGAVTLFFGTTGIGWLIVDWKRVDEVDVVGVVMWNLIAAVSLYAAFRWIGAAMRRPRRRR
jgi:hypothetical protein